MSTPPPLPASTSFVTALGRVSLVLAILGVLAALAQLLFAVLLTDAAVAHAPALPAMLLWILQHRIALTVAMLALSLLFLAVAWGLLRRQEWGRLGFIALLVLGAAANFAALLLVQPFFDNVNDLFPTLLDGPATGPFGAQMRLTRAMTWASGLLGAVAIAALHGWLVWKLCTAAVRAQFRRSGA